MRPYLNALNQAATIAELRAALEQCERALDGKYPWPIYEKFSQKEARATALDAARAALARIGAA